MNLRDDVTYEVEYDHTNKTILYGNITNMLLIISKVNLVLLMMIILHIMVTTS